MTHKEKEGLGHPLSVALRRQHATPGSLRRETLRTSGLTLNFMKWESQSPSPGFTWSRVCRLNGCTPTTSSKFKVTVLVHPPLGGYQVTSATSAFI